MTEENKYWFNGILTTGIVAAIGGVIAYFLKPEWFKTNNAPSSPQIAKNLEKNKPNNGDQEIKKDKYNNIAKKWNSALHEIEKNTTDTYLKKEKLPYNDPENFVKKLNRTLNLVRQPIDKELQGELEEINNDEFIILYRKFLKESKVADLSILNQEMTENEVIEIIKKASPTGKIDADGIASILSNKDGCLYYYYNTENNKLFDAGLSESLRGEKCEIIPDYINRKYTKTRELFSR